jgi:hypothetical protein
MKLLLVMWAWCACDERLRLVVNKTVLYITSYARTGIRKPNCFMSALKAQAYKHVVGFSSCSCPLPTQLI